MGQIFYSNNQDYCIFAINTRGRIRHKAVFRSKTKKLGVCLRVWSQRFTV